MEFEDDGDPFHVANIWRSSALGRDIGIVPSDLFPKLELDISAIKLDNPYAPKDALEKELNLPDIDKFEFGSFDDSIQQLEQDLSLDTDLSVPHPDDVDDIWSADLELKHDGEKESRFFSWEAFEAQTIDHPSPFYLSEAGPLIFDVVLQNKSTDDHSSAGSTPKVIRADALLNCLFNLGVGRSSLLFQFNNRTNSITHSMEAGRMTGLSEPLTQHVISEFSHCGETIRFLQDFVERTYRATNTFPALVALANTVNSIVSTLCSHLESQSAESLLQLRQLFQKPNQLVAYVKHLVNSISSAKSNTMLLIALYTFLEEREQQDRVLRSVGQFVLGRVSTPWLDLVQEWIGMLDLSTASYESEPSFFAEKLPDLEEKPSQSRLSEYTYNPIHMPPFIPSHEGELIYEMGNSVRFLRAHHPEHPIASLKSHGVTIPALNWRFSWEDVNRTAQKVNAFEADLKAAIKKYQTGSVQAPARHDLLAQQPSNSGHLDDSLTDFGKYLAETAEAFETPLASTAEDLPEALLRLITCPGDQSSTNQQIESEIHDFEPPLSLSPLLTIIPLLNKQAQLVNACTLRLFFRSHHLRHHLSLQRQYHLLGDGVFLTSLSRALFSPELKTAERQKGVVRTGATMGLRLGARSTWPPASSELRLALMSVLSDCYHSSELYTSSDLKDEMKRKSNRDENDLPGDLSFSVRQLPESEIAKVMDPNSLCALDFLRLQYVPPSPIHLVITQESLEKYDQIFKFLCRVTRILFVVNHLPRNLRDNVSRRFRVEAIHFVLALASYVFETGIRDKWDDFSHHLDTIEAQLREEDEQQEYGSFVSDGLDKLRQSHEECLDRIMFTLFLRKRHEKVMALLEEILSYILDFGTRHEPYGFDTTELYHEFHSKTKVFLQVCKGLSGKKNQGKGSSDAGDELDIERFVVKMDVSGYNDNRETTI